MRRFEFVEGKSSKFWEVSVEGTDLHLCWGRIGTDGQRKVKSFSDRAAAEKEAEKQMASKVKKGYTEVGETPPQQKPPAAEQCPPVQESLPVKAAPALEEGPPVEESTELPPEDQVVLPDGWRRQVLPWRGGPYLGKLKRVSSSKALKLGLEALDKSVKTRMGQPVVFDSARRSFAGESDPVAQDMAWTLAHSTSSKARAALIDYWVNESGFTRALENIFEVLRLGGGDRHGPTYQWQEDYLFRLRALLAEAEPQDYKVALDWVEQRRRLWEPEAVAAAAVMFPTEGWVWEVIDENGILTRRLAVRAALELEAVLALQKTRGYLSYDDELLPTWMAAMGTRCMGILEYEIKRIHLSSDSAKRVATALGCLPCEEALLELLELEPQNKYISPGLQRWVTLFPRLALTVLSREAAAPKWARMALKAHPQALEAVRAELSPEQLAYIETLEDSDEAPPANLEDCPRILVAPPWTERKKEKKTTLSLEPIPFEPILVWEEGERERWRSKIPLPDYDQTLEEYRAGFGSHAQYMFTGWGVAQQLLRAPETAAVELLDRWTPDDPWSVNDIMQGVVERFQMRALPKLKEYARHSLKDAVTLFGPFADPELGLLAAEAYARLKSARKAGLDYLCRRPYVSALSLIPAALGKAKKERGYAEKALIAMGGAGHRGELMRAAEEYGAGQAVEQLVSRDPLQQLPKSMPSLPDWFDPSWVKRPSLVDGGGLPDECLSNFALMLAISNPEEIYAGIELVKDACTPESMGRFAWSLFELWMDSGASSKEGWCLQALGWLGNDETARKLTPLLKKWPGEGGHARAVTGLQVLTDIGTDVALMHLYGLSQKLKFKGLKKAASEKVDEIAENRGLTSDELGDRLVPDLGLEDDGSLRLDYGERFFTVGFNEHLKPYVRDHEGKMLKSLPKPGKKDGQVAAESYECFKTLKKDVRTVAQQQLVRLELAMCRQRRWSASDFRSFFVEHPLVIHLVRRLVWATFQGSRLLQTFRVVEDRTLANGSDEEFQLDPGATVGLPHCLEMDEADQAAWGELLADYELLQPFEQLGRSTYKVSEAERTAVQLDFLKGRNVEGVRVLSLESRGWRKGPVMDGGCIGWMNKELSGGKIAFLQLNPGLVVGEPNAFPDLVFEELSLGDELESWQPQSHYAFGEISAVDFSELMRDLEPFRELVSA